MTKSSYQHLVLNSNPWFSAVSDYSLQMCLYLRQQGESLLYCADKNHTKMKSHCQSYGIDFCHVPIHQTNVLTWVVSLIRIIYLLTKNKKSLKSVVCFEGREHFLLFFIKVFFPFLLEKVQFIRVRGQAQPIKGNFFSRMLYRYFTNRVVFAARCIQKLVPFALPASKAQVVYYGKDLKLQKSHEPIYSFHSEFAPADFNKLTFLMLGRFDPVKGHDVLLEAYLAASFQLPTQLILIGKSENIRVSDFYHSYAKHFPICKEMGNRYFLQTQNGEKSVYLVDEFFVDLPLLLPQAHFGVIPSLGSEVICRVGVEFLQSGVPVIFSGVGALAEVLDDFGEFVCPAQDVQAFREKLEMAENCFFDAERFRHMREKAFAMGTKRYSLNSFAAIFSNPPENR